MGEVSKKLIIIREEMKLMEFEEFKRLREKSRLLKKAAEVLRVQPEDLPRVIRRFKREIEEMKKLL